MFALVFFVLAILATVVHGMVKKWGSCRERTEVFLSYVLFFNMGLMGLMAAYAHVFMGPEIARQIGWQPGSPFQFEIGMANLSYGVLGILSYFLRGNFWTASIIGWSVLLLGCFVGHMIDYIVHQNSAPLNIGVYVWLNDLILPILTLSLLVYVRPHSNRR